MFFIRVALANSSQIYTRLLIIYHVSCTTPFNVCTLLGQNEIYLTNSTHFSQYYFYVTKSCSLIKLILYTFVIAEQKP